VVMSVSGMEERNVPNRTLNFFCGTVIGAFLFSFGAGRLSCVASLLALAVNCGHLGGDLSAATNDASHARAGSSSARSGTFEREALRMAEAVMTSSGGCGDGTVGSRCCRLCSTSEMAMRVVTVDRDEWWNRIGDRRAPGREIPQD
jgi:cytochrome c5